MSTPDRYQPAPDVEVKHPQRSKDAVLYQINQRQMTSEGTFCAAAAHLPRIRDLGVDVVWLMPINPIGQRNRKGDLGRPYAVQDYFAVNPEFGDLQDLRDFVATAHDLGLRVILDWVANHTAWVNVLVDLLPRQAGGVMRAPGTLGGRSRRLRGLGASEREHERRRDREVRPQ